MRLRVDLIPRDELIFHDVVLVVDVIRATTTAAAFLEAGASQLLLAPDLASARKLRTKGVMIAGEQDGLKPEGFDYGNSPREALEAPVGGKQVVMATTNGTKAAHLASKTAQHILLASLYNAHAAARLALDLAEEEVAILCAGKEGRVGLDDIYTAGVLADFLQLMGSFQLDDGAQVALATKSVYPDPLEPLRSSAAALALKQAGLEADIAFCAQLAASPAVPLLEDRTEKALVFRRADPVRNALVSSQSKLL